MYFCYKPTYGSTQPMDNSDCGVLNSLSKATKPVGHRNRPIIIIGVRTHHGVHETTIHNQCEARTIRLHFRHSDMDMGPICWIQPIF